MKENRPNIFRLLNPELPTLRVPSNSARKQSNPLRDLAKVTTTAVKNNKYIYLDLVDNTGIRLLQKTQQNCDYDSDEDCQKLGDLCIANLKNLSKGSQQMYRYLDGLKSDRNKKQKVESVLNGRFGCKTPRCSYSKSPVQMTSQQVQQFIEQIKDKAIEDKLNHGERQLTKKITVLGEASPRNYRHLITSKVTTQSEIEEYTRINNMFSNIKQITTSKNSFGLPRLSNKSASLQLRHAKRRLQ